jgi:hypothetical protein
MARQAPAGLLGVHITLPATIPPEVGAALPSGVAPAGLSQKERAAFDAVVALGKHDSGYNLMMTTRPQNIGYALTDSPVGLAAWMLGHPGFAKWTFGSDPEQTPTRDEVLDDISLYWLTNTPTSAARAYWENRGRRSCSPRRSARRSGRCEPASSNDRYDDGVDKRFASASSERQRFRESTRVAAR